MNATSSLPTVYLTLAEEPRHGFETLIVIQVGRRRPRHHHHVGVVDKLGAVRPVEFP